MVDGYFLPKSPRTIFEAGEQAKVPLLAGWNTQEGNYPAILGKEAATVTNYNKAIERLYGAQAPQVLKVYGVTSDDAVQQAATDLASDRFIGYSTWKLTDAQHKTGGKPVFRYLYARPRPVMRAEMGNAVANLAGGISRDTTASKPVAPPASGAVHSAEIEYAMGNLPHNRVYDWQPEDYRVSAVMQAYFANFIKRGDPNGPGVPKWSALPANGEAPVMRIDVDSKLQMDKHRPRYLMLESLPR